MRKCNYLLLILFLACSAPDAQNKVEPIKEAVNTEIDKAKSAMNSISEVDAEPQHVDNIIAKNAQPKLISNQFKFTEGPAVDKDGNVFFTDQPNDKIWKWSTDGSLEMYMDKTGRSNGLYFDNDGNLWACADENFELWQIPSSKIKKNLAGGFGGKKFNGPNDLWIDEGNGVYFTDPYYQRPYWTRTKKEMASEDVYYFNLKTRAFQRIADDLVQPNGIVGSADGKQLYISDIGDNKTYVYDITAPGKLENKKLFCELGSDGMTTDHLGNVYLTGKGVTVFDKTGKQIEHIAIDQEWTANVVFGGAKQDLLFITASTAIYTLQMNVHGVR